VRLALLLLALQLATLLAPLGSGLTGYKVLAEVVMEVPAVALVDGSVQGVMSKLHVVVAWPGSGTVYFTARPLTELDTQAAARVAVLVASILAGVDYRGYDYFIRLEANSSIVGGPSASGAIAVAVLAALTGVSVRSDASMTGMVEPDFSLGPVGGVPQKLEAVARSGKKLFVIPQGQSVAIDLRSGVKVNVTALGARLGVEVREAPDVLSAYQILTGSRLSLPRLEHPGYPDWFRESLVRVYRNLTGFALDAIAGIDLAELPTRARAIVSSMLDDAREALNQAREAFNEDRLYVAASRAFYAALRALEAKLMYTWATQGASRLVDELTRLIGSSRKTLEDALAKARTLEARQLTAEALQILVVAFDRLSSGLDAVATAETLLHTGRLGDALTAAAYAAVRTLTVSHWLEVASKALEHGRAVERSRLVDSVYMVMEYAATSVDYLSALGYSVTAVEEALRSARERLERGEIVEALSLTVSALSATTRYLREAFEVVAPDTASLRLHVEALAARSLEAGVQPIIPLLYLEYGSWFEELGGVDQAIEMYEYAAAYALLLHSLVPAEAPAPPAGRAVAPATTITVTVTRTVNTTTTVTLRPEPVTVTVTETTTARMVEPVYSYVAGIAIALSVVSLALALIRARRR
jgi:uncharacterized protein